MFFALLFSHSRGGLLGLSAGLFCFVLLMMLRRYLRRWTVLLVLFIFAAVLLAFFMMPEQFLSSVSRFQEQQLDISLQVRWEIWKTQWHIFHDFPIFGAGLGAFSHLARRYQTFHWHNRLAYSESDVMQFLAETGITGLLLLCGMAGSVFLYILSRWRIRRSRWAVALTAGQLSALVCLMVHAFVDFNFRIPSNALLFTVIAALASVTVATREHRRSGSV